MICEKGMNVSLQFTIHFDVVCKCLTVIKADEQAVNFACTLELTLKNNVNNNCYNKEKKRTLLTQFLLVFTVLEW